MNRPTPSVARVTAWVGRCSAGRACRSGEAGDRWSCVAVVPDQSPGHRLGSLRRVGSPSAAETIEPFIRMCQERANESESLNLASSASWRTTSRMFSRCSMLALPAGCAEPSSSNTLMNEQASKSSPTSRHDDPPPHALSGRRARAKCSALADWPASHTRSARLLRSRAVEARPGRRPPSAWKPLLLRADRTAASTCLQRRGADEDAADPRQGCPVGCGSRLLT